MSLRWQIAIALATVAAVVGAAAGIGAYLTTARELRGSVDDSLVTVAERAAEQNSGRDGGRGDHSPDAPTCPGASDLAPAADVQTIDSAGTATACLTPTGGSIAVPDEPVAGYRNVEHDGEQYRVLIATSGDGFVQIARSLSETDRVLGQLRLRLLALVGLGVAVALVAGWVIARGIAGPIIRLRSTAETIAETGDLDTPVPVAGPTEVASLGRSFTAMVAALSTSRTQQRRLVDDAGHEMRTPLTSLTTNLEHLEHFDQLEAPERSDVLDAVQLDVAELTHLLTELVELATDRADDEEPELLSLAAVARDIAQRTSRRSGRTIVVRDAGSPVAGGVTDPGPLVLARPHLIERAISNLLDNAVKYAPGATDIEVDVDGGRLEVTDRGPGIDPGDLPHVFDRFYRATTARTEPGSGLGLAIVRQIVERHGGTVSAGPRPQGSGAVVGFQLPTRDA